MIQVVQCTLMENHRENIYYEANLVWIHGFKHEGRVGVTQNDFVTINDDGMALQGLHTYINLRKTNLKRKSYAKMSHKSVSIKGMYSKLV